VDVKLSCSCGSVKGKVINTSSDDGNRIVCCCNDCQAFARHLGCDETVLDSFGGTDIFQVAQAQIRITQGAEHLRALRLSPTGLTRWYTDCCNTPVANTVNAKLPFVGLIHTFIVVKGSRDKVLGPVKAYVQTQYAIGAPDYPYSSKKFPLGVTVKIALKILKWKSKGLEQPSVFFDEQGLPVSKPTVIA